MDINDWQRFCRTGSVRSYLKYKAGKTGDGHKKRGGAADRKDGE